MEILQLKYFKAVAECENMTSAAKKLCVAQSAVSQSIARLENELGVQLFTRIGKRIQLNRCGALLLRRLPSILGSIDNIKLELQEISCNPEQHINLKVLSCSTLLPQLLKSFQTEYPTISFSLMQSVDEGDYDICISSALWGNTHQQDTTLMKEEILLVVPRKNIIVTQDCISLHDFTGTDFISLSKGSVFRFITDLYCQNTGFNPHIIFAER